MELLTLVSVIAAISAAYLSWLQLDRQQQRWTTEDARISPRGLLLTSGEYSIEGWYHGVWQATNRAPFEIEVISIVAHSPESLELAELDPASDGPVQFMKAMNPGKFLRANKVLAPFRPPGEFGTAGSNFMYRISSSPETDRGKAIPVEIFLRELDNPTQRYAVRCEALVPIKPI